MARRMWRQIKKRFPEFIRKPLSSFSKGSSWRARSYELWLTPTKQIIITRRRFRTRAEKRSQRYWQRVISLRWLPGASKEIGLSYHRRRRSARYYQGLWLRTATTAIVGIGLIGMAHFGLQLLPEHSSQSNPDFDVPAPVAATAPELEDADDGFLEPSEPEQLRVEAIELDSELMELGQEADGSMEVPPLESDVAGWYRYGPTPGEQGPAVIAGHVDNREGPSVFWRLDELSSGDEVEVRREDGETVRFEVYEVRSFAQDSFPTDLVYGNTEDAQLRLITCGGEFDWRERAYSHNTVVFARMLDE